MDKNTVFPVDFCFFGFHKKEKKCFRFGDKMFSNDKFPIFVPEIQTQSDMAVILGIDVGGSTTKIVGIENGKLKSPLFITATEPVTSLFGAFGKYLYDNQPCKTSDRLSSPA